MILVTSVKREVLQRITRNGRIVAEFYSYQNVSALRDAKVGELVFLTEDNEEEVTRNSSGVIAKIESISMDYVRTSDPHFEERELLRIRAKLSYAGHGLVRKIVRGGDRALVDVAQDNHALIG